MAAAQTGPRFAPLATGQVTSVSPDRLVLVTDRDMSAGLRKGTALTFVLTAETLILELDGRSGLVGAGGGRPYATASDGIAKRS